MIFVPVKKTVLRQLRLNFFAEDITHISRFEPIKLVMLLIYV